VRLAPNTDLGFADLEYHRYQVQLGAGTIQYRVLRNQDAQVEIDTPSIAAKPLQVGNTGSLCSMTEPHANHRALGGTRNL
jgi:hypothetical protein